MVNSTQASLRQTAPFLSHPTVSVVTVCLNAQDQLEKTIHSVVEQDYGSIEYIIIDGASTDGTLDIVTKYRQHVHSLVSEADEGLYDAMNKGLKIASGEIVTFLNAGDRFSSQKSVADVVNAFLEQPDAELVYGDYLAQYHEYAKRIHQPKQLSLWHLWLRSVCHQTIFARQRLFDAIGGFDTSLPIGADWDWTLRAVLEHKAAAYHLDMPVCNFAMGGICSNKARLRKDKSLLRQRHFSKSQRTLFPCLELLYKINLRLRTCDLSLPYALSPSRKQEIPRSERKSSKRV